MALAAVLSAMRSLILDAPPLPANQGDRIVALREMFPSLSQDEVEDLSKMEPARLQIYTTSIFNGESDLLGSCYKATVALLSRSLETREKNLNLLSFVQSLHHFHPWKTATTEGLVENFARGLADPRIEVGPLRRELVECSRFERHLFYARRTRSIDCDPKGSLQLGDLAELTVGEILELRWRMPQTVFFDTFAFDLGRFLAAFRRDGSLPAVLDEREVEIVFSRDRENMVRWREFEPALFAYFQRCGTTGGVLADMAGAVLNDLPESTPEDEGFRKFLEALRSAIECGVIVLPKTI